MAKWVVITKKADFEKITKEFQISPMLARIIRNRDLENLDEIRDYLETPLSKLHSPNQLPDIDLARKLILDKVNAQKEIRIIGDYDIDGVMATYILWKGITSMGGKVSVLIPDRIVDGYGMNEQLVKQTYEAGIDTIITCDNGISAMEPIAYAKSLGMTVVVTDHHEVPFEEMCEKEGGEVVRREILPPADAIVNPKRSDSKYPYSGICGAFVAYKVVEAMGVFDNCTDAEELRKELLGFAAFATIGDVMVLMDENRILVKHGLKYMEETSNIGLKALLDATQLSGKKLEVYHVGFILGPCINATGRLDSAARAFSLFACSDHRECVQIASELKELNDSRKSMTLENTEKAMQIIQEKGFAKDGIIVVYLEQCHESLAGIIAGRLREKFYKPVFVLTRTQEGVKGSGRSIEAYHMYEELVKAKQFLTKFGGHHLAAGLSMEEDQVDAFRRYLNANHKLSQSDFEEKIKIDLVLPISYITQALVEELSILEPFGMGNEKPLFAQKNLQIIKISILGKNKNVINMTLKDQEGNEIIAVLFHQAEVFLEQLYNLYGQQAVSLINSSKGDKVHIKAVFYPQINEFRNQKTTQIVLKEYAFEDVFLE